MLMFIFSVHDDYYVVASSPGHSHVFNVARIARKRMGFSIHARMDNAPGICEINDLLIVHFLVDLLVWSFDTAWGFDSGSDIHIMLCKSTSTVDAAC